MRSLARAITTLCAFLPSLAMALDYVVESPVSLSLVAHHTSNESVKTKGSQEITRTTHVRRVFTNATILDALVAQEVIPSRSGWRLVAVWATSADNETGYTFYVQNKTFPDELHPLPESLLSFKPVAAAVARKHSLADSTITAGKESYRVFSRLKFGDNDSSGELLGLITGDASYSRPRKADAALYVPAAARFEGSGPLAPTTDSSPPAAHVTGTVTFSAGKLVPRSRYQGFIGGGTSSSGSSSSSGTLTLGGSNSYTGATTITGGTLSGAGLTKTGSGSLTLSGGSTLNLGGTTGTITSGTPITLLDGRTITLAPNATLIVTGSGLDQFDLLNLPPSATFTDGVLTIRGSALVTPPATDPVAVPAAP